MSILEMQLKAVNSVFFSKVLEKKFLQFRKFFGKK